MYLVVVTRKRDGFQATGAASLGFDFAYSSLKHLCGVMRKRSGPLEEKPDFTFENTKVKVQLKNLPQTDTFVLSLADWNRADWYKRNL